MPGHRRSLARRGEVRLIARMAVNRIPLEKRGARDCGDGESPASEGERAGHKSCLFRQPRKLAPQFRHTVLANLLAASVQQQLVMDVQRTIN